MPGLIIVGDDALAAELVVHASRLLPRVKASARSHAALGARTARALAPRLTGEYARSIQSSGSSWGSDHPAAHRLEVGFHGVDSLGRRRDDPPRAHHGPASDHVEGEWVEALGDIADLGVS